MLGSAELSPLLSRIARQIEPIYKPVTKRGITKKVDSIRQQDLAKQEVKRAQSHAEMFQKTPAWDLVLRIFGDEVNHLEFPEGDTELQGAMNILKSFYAYSIDGGLNRNIDITLGGQKEPIVLHADSHTMLNRTSFVNQVHKLAQKGDASLPVALGMIDIADVRMSDFPVEGTHFRPADIVVNDAAKTLDRVLASVWHEKGYDAKDTGKTYVTGRYGGDEFVFSLIGNFENADELKREIGDRLREEIHTKSQYIKKTDGEIISQQMGLKKDDKGQEQVEWIDVLSHDIDKQKYLRYFDRGLILTNSEFEKIKNQPEEEPSISRMYPPEIRENLEKKQEYLAQKHPEMAVALALAKHFDDFESQKQPSKHVVTKRQQAIVHLIENYVYDKLLNDAVYSKFDFLEHAKRDEFKEVAVIDFKCIKELNELTNYADADQVIQQLWTKLRGMIASHRDAYMVGRAGGTFLIGIRKGNDTLSKKNLLQLSDFTFSLRGKEISLPLGVQIGDVNKAMDGASNDALYKIYQLAKDVGKGIGWIADSNYQLHDPPTQKDLLWKFFNGKRKVERCHSILSLEQKVDEKDKMIFNQMLRS